MHPEAAFLAGYALALTFAAIGLEALGRRSTDPWTARTLAACEPPAERPGRDGAEWPHSEVPTFHLGLSAVAVAAAFVITAVSAVRHHEPAELLAHGALFFVIAARIRHLVTRHRFRSPGAVDRGDR